MMILPSDLLGKYGVELVAMELPRVVFTFPNWIYCRDISGFANNCPCGVCGRELTTCPLYIGPMFGKSFLNKLACKFDGTENIFCLLCPSSNQVCTPTRPVGISSVFQRPCAVPIYDRKAELCKRLHTSLCTMLSNCFHKEMAVSNLLSVPLIHRK